MPRKSSNDTAPLYRKPRADVYTGLLFIALVALVLGIVSLYLEMADYKFEFRRAPTVSTGAAWPAAVAVVARPASYGWHGPSDGSLA